MKKIVSIVIAVVLVLASAVLLVACSDDALPAAKEGAKVAIQTAYDGYVEVDYSAENWVTLTKAKDDGLTAVDAAIAVEEVAAASTKAIADMDAVETSAETITAAKTAAKADIQAAFEGYTEADYSAENWVTLTKAKDDGLTAVDAAIAVEEVAAASAKAIADMAAVETSAETITAAKTAAKADILAAFDGYTDADYFAANWGVLTTAKDNGIAAVEAATTLEAITAAKDTAIADMAAVETSAETITAAKTAAKADILAAFEGYTEADYSAANWVILTTAKDNGIAAVDEATTLQAITAAKDTAIADMAAVETSAETITAAKTAAKADIQAAFDGYTEADYFAANWGVLTTAKDNGIAAVEAATTLEAITAAKDTAIADMAAVETMVDNYVASSEEDVTAALALKSEKITLADDLALTQGLTISHNMTLDLAEFTLSYAPSYAARAVAAESAKAAITVSNGAKLIIKNGTATITNGNIINVLGAGSEVEIVDGTYTIITTNAINKKPKDIIKLSDGAKVTIQGGTFTATGYDGADGFVQAAIGRAFDMDTVLTINGGTFASNQYGFCALFDGKIVLNGGTVETEWMAFSGNGTASNAYFEINGGAITVPETEVAIYMPSQGTLKIMSGTITGGTAVDARMGTITIGAAAVLKATGQPMDLTAVPNSTAVCNGSAIVLNTHFYDNNAGGGNNILTITIEQGATLSAANNSIITTYDWGVVPQVVDAKFGTYASHVVSFEHNGGTVYKKTVTNEEELTKSLQNARKGTTIYLANDIQMTKQITLDGAMDVTLDLGENRLFGEINDGVNRLFVTRDTAVLRVKNGTIDAIGSAVVDANGKVTGGKGAYGAFRAETGSKLYLSDLVMTNGRPNGLNVKVATGSYAELRNVNIVSEYGGGVEAATGKIDMYDCNFTQTKYYDWCSTNVSASSEGANIGELNVYGGSFISENYGVYVFNSGGIISLSGGVSITATSEKSAIQLDQTVNQKITKICINDTKIIAGNIRITNNAEIEVGCNEGLKLVAAVLAAGKTFVGKIMLTADIDLTGAEWTALTGTLTGTIDGGGHTITGLASASELIANVDESKISNLNFVAA